MKTNTILFLLISLIITGGSLRAQSSTPGDTLGSFNAGILTPTPDRTLMGVEFAEGYFWITGADPDDLWQHKLYKISADGKTLVDSWSYGVEAASWKDLAYDGQFLYVTDIDTIRQIDMQTGQKTGFKIPAPEYYVSGLAYDAATDHFWVSGDGNVIFEIDREGNIINSVSFSPDLPATGLAWDVWSEGGPYLWIWSMKYTPADVRPQAFQLSPQTGQLTGAGFEGVLMNPQAPYGADYALGATITDQLVPGKVAFVGLHGSSYQTYNDQLDWVVIYDLDPAGTGLPGPQISVIPESIQNNLMPGDSVDVPVLVSNLSDAYALNWQALLEYPGMNDTTGTPGELLLSFDASALITPEPDNRLRALTFAGGNIYVSSRANSNGQFRLYEMAAGGTELLKTWTFYSISTGWKAMASDDRYIYGVQQYQINKFDPVGDSLVETYPLTGFSPNAMAYDPQREYFYLGGGSGAIKVVNKQDEEINFFVTPYAIQGLSWDSWSPGGPYLWAFYLTSDSLMKAIRLNPETGGAAGSGFEALNLSGDPDSPDFPAGIAITPNWQQNRLVAVTLQESNTLPGDGNDKVAVYDLATTPPPAWIGLIDPAYGETAPLNTDTLYVRLHAIMEDTLMTAQVVISSNDVLNPQVIIPVNFRMLPEIFTGVGDQKEHSPSLIRNIFPNPAQNAVSMVMDLQEPAATIRIFSPTGRLVKFFTSADKSISLDISDWVPGLYQIVVSSSTRMDRRKLIVK